MSDLPMFAHRQHPMVIGALGRLATQGGWARILAGERVGTHRLKGVLVAPQHLAGGRVLTVADAGALVPDAASVDVRAYDFGEQVMMPGRRP